MSSTRRPKFIAAWDIALCLLVVYIAKVSPAPPQIRTFGEYAIVMTWPRGDNDVDLYVRDAIGNICYFNDLQVDGMQLEHDDLGFSGSGYGKLNEERMIMRSVQKGQYVINAQMYRRSQGTGPMKVTISLVDLRGDDHEVTRQTVDLTKNGDEKTAFRISFDAQGNPHGINHLPTSLVNTTTSYSSSGNGATGP